MKQRNLETYYSFPNIDKSNNCFIYSHNVDPLRFDNIIPEGSYHAEDINEFIQREMRTNNNNNNNWDDLYSAVRMGITKNKGAVTYKLIVIRLSKQKGLEFCFKAVYCR